jgi:putative endonuclease
MQAPLNRAFLRVFLMERGTPGVIEDKLVAAQLARFPAPHRSKAMFTPGSSALLYPMSDTRRFIPVEQWEDERQVLGLEGERIAIAFLTSCGWSVEAHRFRLGRHDVDLVIRRGSTVAFVEVKTRRSRTCGSGLEAVNWRKQRDIARVASVWVLRHGRPGDEYRFDLLVVENLAIRGSTVEHVPDAWRPSGLWT